MKQLIKFKSVLCLLATLAILCVVGFGILPTHAEELPPEESTEETAPPVVDENTGTEMVTPETETKPDTETTEPTPDTETPKEPEEDAFDLEDLKNLLIQNLKDRYGDDYQIVYDGIIAQWGSIENYLREFGANVLPEQYHVGWDKFINWLNEYAPVWATALAVGGVILIAICGKKALKKVFDLLAERVTRIVDDKIKPIADEMNKQSSAMIAQNKAIQTIVPKTEQGDDAKMELKNSEKELSK